MDKAIGRAWCFTINNPKAKPELTHTRYVVYQLEKGEEGTEHYQGFVYFDKLVSFKQLKEMLPTAHIEKAKSIEASIKYCKKEDSRVDGPWESGEPPQQGKRSDLDACAAMVMAGASNHEVAKEHPATFTRYSNGLAALRSALQSAEPRTHQTIGISVFGVPGIGKSYWAQKTYPGAYWKAKGPWWNGYNRHEVVILDEFYGWLPFDTLCRLLDATPYTVEIKGGFVEFVAKTIVFLSNKHVEDWYRSVDTIHQVAVKRRITQMEILVFKADPTPRVSPIFHPPPPTHIGDQQ